MPKNIPFITVSLLFLIFFFLLFATGCQSSALSGVPTAAAVAASPTMQPTQPPAPTTPSTPTTIPTSTPVVQLETAVPIPTSTLAPTIPPEPTTPTVGVPATIGFSNQARPILSYQFKNGPTQLVFVGAIHGGYEWNTALLAYEAIDFFTANPELVPDEVTLHIIPAANPDGLFRVTQREGRFERADIIEDTIPGRFNANEVDLNRNWDCDWSPEAQWRQNPVSGGTAAFSEPETAALRDFILARFPAGVIFWHSAANGVYAAGCPETHPSSFALATQFGTAAGYPVYEKFSAYPITGDAGDWLAQQGIPSITVELINHFNTDWEKNLAGMLAVMDSYRIEPIEESGE